ncbi:hypothetical protein, partial [Halorubrum sp. ARQ200]|uniref:hypothetical protein n=1 Tax=Halorubrum sp. ARQ200 TaxID=1855872 RepID=UPI0011398A08
MVDPIFTYVGGIGFLVLIIGSMLYLMYNYEGVDEEDTPSESVVRGAGPVAAENEANEPVDGAADDAMDAVEAAESDEAAAEEDEAAEAEVDDEEAEATTEEDDEEAETTTEEDDEEAET